MSDLLKSTFAAIERRDRKVATATVNVMKELFLASVESETERHAIHELFAVLTPTAVDRAIVEADSVEVVDERGPNSIVDLVDERKT